MKIITSGRGTGKTVSLIRYANVTGCTIVVTNSDRRQYICCIAANFGMKIPMIKTINEIMHRCDGYRFDVVIDDLEDVVSGLIPFKTILATTSAKLGTLDDIKEEIMHENNHCVYRWGM